MLLNKWQRKLFARAYRDEAGEGGDTGGGTGDNDNLNKGGNDDTSNKGGGAGDKGGSDNGDKGGSKISDAEALLVKEVMAKKTALKEANDQLAQAKEQLKQFEGIDPAAVKKLVQAQKDAETAQLEAKGEWDRLRERMAEEHGKELTVAEQRAKDLADELNKSVGVINELTIGNAFGVSKFISEEMTLPPAKARALYGDHFDFVDGKVVGYDKPRGAKERTAYVDAKGDPVSFEEAIRKVVDADPDRDTLLKSRMKKGADSSSLKGDAPKKSVTPPRGVDRIAAGLKGSK